MAAMADGDRSSPTEVYAATDRPSRGNGPSTRPETVAEGEGEGEPGSTGARSRRLGARRPRRRRGRRSEHGVACVSDRLRGRASVVASQDASSQSTLSGRVVRAPGRVARSSRRRTRRRERKTAAVDDGSGKERCCCGSCPSSTVDRIRRTLERTGAAPSASASASTSASTSTWRDVQAMLLDQCRSARGCDRAPDAAVQGRCSITGIHQEGKPAAPREMWKVRLCDGPGGRASERRHEDTGRRGREIRPAAVEGGSWGRRIRDRLEEHA